MGKGTPIHLDLLDCPEVLGFAHTAQKLCDVMEQVDNLPKVYFLEQL